MIILNDLLVQADQAPYSLFSVTRIGLALVAGGIIYFLILEKTVLPVQTAQAGDTPESPQHDMITTWQLPDTLRHCVLPAGSRLAGMSREEAGLWNTYRLHVLSLTQEREVVHTPWRFTRFSEGQELRLLGGADDFKRFVDDYALTATSPPHAGQGGSESACFTEFVIPPHSPIAGKTVRQLALRNMYGVDPIILLSGKQEYRSTFSDIPLGVGDVIVAYGPTENLLATGDNRKLALLTPVDPPRGTPVRKPLRAVLCAAVAVVLKPVPHDARLDQVQEIITLVDGTCLTALPRVVRWALYQTDQRAAKAHVQFEVLKGVPVEADITAANVAEPATLKQQLRPGRCYVIDRGYAEYALFQAILDAQSSFVGRLRDNAVLDVTEERPVSPEAARAGLLRDTVGRLGAKKNQGDLNVPVRIVEVACRPHRKTTGKTARGGPEQGDRLRLVTSCLDLPPEVIGAVYQSRWQIEIFFRTFKHVLGCRHLISYSDNGIALQTYAAILACLLIALWTGRKPTLRTWEMVRFYFSGWASAEELQAHIDRLQVQPKPVQA